MYFFQSAEFDDGDSSAPETMDAIRDFVSDRTDVERNEEEYLGYSSIDEDEVYEITEALAPPTRAQPNASFKWTAKQFNPEIHEFDNTNSGCKIEGNPDNLALKYFEFFFSQDIMEEIANQTNKYFEYLIRQESSSRDLQKWKQIEYKELYCFFAVILLMPHNKKNKINSYWSTDEFIHSPIFSRLMKRDRFLLISKLLHFKDNDAPNENRDSLEKIRIIVDHLKMKFKEAFSPFKNICIDESLLLFRGRVFFRQYIPSKRHRFGIKFFLLCDCETGYILDFIIYTGASTNIKEFEVADIGKSGNIVLTLLEPYLKNGHTLFVDNWYTSPSLFDYLYKNKTTACGTVKRNRKNMPTFTEKLEKSEFTHRSTENLLAVKWKDKREVHMLTSCHIPGAKETGKKDRETGRVIMKPTCVVDYNENMGAVDKSDMLLSSTECVRKTMKWYKKVFFHLLDCTVLNCYQLYKCNTENKIALENFHLDLVKQIIAKYHTPISTRRVGRRVKDQNVELRLTERHFPKILPSTDKKKNAAKRCYVCSKNNKRRETRYFCSNCNDIPLCITPCFELYHTKKNF